MFLHWISLGIAERNLKFFNIDLFLKNLFGIFICFQNCYYFWQCANYYSRHYFFHDLDSFYYWFGYESVKIDHHLDNLLLQLYLIDDLREYLIYSYFHLLHLIFENVCYFLNNFTLSFYFLILMQSSFHHYLVICCCCCWYSYSFSCLNFDHYFLSHYF